MKETLFLLLTVGLALYGCVSLIRRVTERRRAGVRVVLLRGETAEATLRAALPSAGPLIAVDGGIPPELREPIAALCVELGAEGPVPPSQILTKIEALSDFSIYKRG